MSDAPAAGLDFIRQIIADDNVSGKHGGRVATRFPPEPNGYLHIGHAKSICLNFGIAAENGGQCNLRFDDTNPTKEDQDFVDAITQDVRWLGGDWGDGLTHASDYYERFYACAVALIEAGKAYVDSQSAEEIRESRGTLTGAGMDSPHRGRSVAENLDLFSRMRAGEFDEFDLNSFFEASGKGILAQFKHKRDIQKWLDIIRGGYMPTATDYLKTGTRPPFPYSDVRLLPYLQHSFWFMPNVAACHAMANLLAEKHNVFWHDYTVVVAAGVSAGIGLDALPPVRQAIGSGLESKTITLSCGKLTTGVTVPQWSSLAPS